jgi:hypothetical protein
VPPRGFASMAALLVAGALAFVLLPAPPAKHE